MNAEFIPVPGFEEYLMSKDGVFLNRRNRKPLKFSNEKSSEYPRVKLNGKRYNVHRLLAKAFIPNPKNLPQVNHKDGNKFNYSLSNLEWCSMQENMTHAKETGLLVKGRQVHTNILDEVQVLTIRQCVKDGMKQLDVANYFKVSESTVQAIHKRRNWKHL